MPQQVLFTPITTCERLYDFGMTDSQLICFLKIASCKYGDMAHDLFEKNAKGFRNKCAERQLLLLHKNIETVACWTPKSRVGLEYPSYYVVNFISYAGTQNTTFIINIKGKIFNLLFTTAGSLQANLDNGVNVINADPVFKAQRDGNRLWIYAPAGYGDAHYPVTLAQSPNVQIVYSPVTTAGFQGGSVPCGSYVDWLGVYHEAPEDCLDEQQIGNIIDQIKKFVDCKCMTTDEILNDDID